jgi:hypothetical protein
VVSSSKTGDQLLVMFVKPASEIVGHANVKSARRAKRGIRVSHAPLGFHGRQEPRFLALLGMTTPW